MRNPTNESSNNNFSPIKIFFMSSLIGIKRTFLGFPIEYPCENVRVRLQASPTMNFSYSFIKSILINEGISGFYKGGLLTFGKSILRQTYLNPTQVYFKIAYGKILPPDVNNRFPDIKNLFAGFTMASLSALILSPLERLKTVLITRNSQSLPLQVHGYKSSYKFFFKGTSSYYLKSIVSWSTFLVAEERIRKLVKFYFIPSANETTLLPFPYLLLVGVLGGGISLLFTSPLETITTQIQKADSKQSATIRSTYYSLVQNHGYKVLYAGWKPKFLLYLLTTIYSSAAIQETELLYLGQDKRNNDVPQAKLKISFFSNQSRDHSVHTDHDKDLSEKNKNNI